MYSMEIVRLAVAVNVVLVLCSVTPSNAATTTPPSGEEEVKVMPCIQKLVPCQLYLNSVVPPPPPTCCMPLREMVETDATCLCAVFNDDEMLKSLNLTKANALDLPKACGANADVSKCKASTGSTSTPPSTSPATPKTPPASPKTPPASSTGSGSTGDSASSTSKPSNSAPAINFAGLSFASAFAALATIFF